MKLVRMFVLFTAAILAVSSVVAQPQPATPVEKEATVYGVSLKYFEAGQGEPVILLHGLGGVKEEWMTSLGALSANHRVYALDQVGFGHSGKPLLEYKIATFSDFLFGFMQSQNLSKATLVGNSLGGWIAMDFAIRRPEMVDKLVLVDSAGLPFGKMPPVDLNPSTLADMRALLESLFFNKKLATDEFVLQAFTAHMSNNDAYTIQRTMAGFGQNQFVDAKLASIHAPTLVVWGREDELLPESMGEKLRDAIPGAKLAVFDQCGHVPQLEKPADFNKAVLDFLGK